jgi:hypothetical protein
VLTMHEQRQSLRKAVPRVQQPAKLAARREGTRSPSDDPDFQPPQTLKSRLKSRVDLSADRSGIVPRTPVFKE